MLEVLYLVRVAPEVELAADLQELWNPGMNADRGPATTVGLRLHVHR